MQQLQLYQNEMAYEITNELEDSIKMLRPSSLKE